MQIIEAPWSVTCKTGATWVSTVHLESVSEHGGITGISATRLKLILATFRRCTSTLFKLFWSDLMVSKFTKKKTKTGTFSSNGKKNGMLLSSYLNCLPQPLDKKQTGYRKVRYRPSTNEVADDGHNWWPQDLQIYGGNLSASVNVPKLIWW